MAHYSPHICTAALLSLSVGVSAQERQPNVILLFSDQHNADVFGWTGHPDAITPNLDRMARTGVVFNRAYCQDAISVASRTSLFTGLYPRTTGILDNNKSETEVLQETVSLQRIFRRTVTRPTLSANGIFLEKRMKAGLSVVSITVKIQPITTTSNGSENKATRRSSVKIGPRSSENFRRGISWKAPNIRKPGWAPGRQNFRPTRPWKPSLPGIQSKSSASTHVRTSRSSASPRSIVPISPIRLFLNIWPITTMPHGGRAQMQEGRSPCRCHSASRPRICLRHWLVSGQTKREYGVSD